jgi:hypothetical protein
MWGTLSGSGFRLNIYYLRQDGIKQRHALRRHRHAVAIATDKAKLRDLVDSVDIEQIVGSDARPLRQAAKANPLGQSQTHEQAFCGARCRIETIFAADAMSVTFNSG